jgi:lysophospholipid acyltransferase (LPLAT)-like uncharacterized protein
MRIRHPWLIKVAAFVVALLVRLLLATVRYHYRPQGANVDPHRPHLLARYLYAFWHENFLLLAYHYARPDIHVLISQHADGQIIAGACRQLGFQVVAGSSTRGGVEAVRQMTRLAQIAHLAMTPDGPRGPRRQVQMGLIYLAARTGLPIVPIGIGWSRAWRMNSWDRFAVPVPFSAATVVTLEPMVVLDTADKDKLEEYRRQVQQAMEQASDIAQGYYEARPAVAAARQKAA